MKPLTRIKEFVLEQSDTQPLSRRISLYRDLAEISGSASEAAELVVLAEDLEEIQRKHRQLMLDFKRRSEG